MLEVVAAIVEDERGHILLAQRPIGKKFAGEWEFPGGKLEAGEGLEQALKRELLEELHLAVDVRAKLGVYSHNYDSGKVILHVFVVLPLSHPIPTKDVQNFEWFLPSQIDPEILLEADRPALHDYLSQAKGRSKFK